MDIIIVRHFGNRILSNNIDIIKNVLKMYSLKVIYGIIIRKKILTSKSEIYIK